MTTTLNILLVEDNEDDAELVSLALRRGNFQPSVQRVSSAKALTAALEARAWDVILCDYSLPGFGGEEALRVVRDTVGWDVPVIFVSGHIGEEAAVELMQAGAQDFVNKNKLARLPGAIKRELDARGLRIEKRRTDAMLDEERSLLRQLMTSIPDAIYFKDTQLRYTRLNDAEWRALNATGEAEVVGATAEQFLPPDRARARREQEEDVVANGRTLVNSVEQVKQADGTVRWFAATKAPIRDRDGKITGLVGISRDITERKFNEQLKDEFIATVSHELRTPLTSIAGSLSLLAGGAVGGLSDAALRLLKIGLRQLPTHDSPHQRYLGHGAHPNGHGRGGARAGRIAPGCRASHRGQPWVCREPWRCGPA